MAVYDPDKYRIRCGDHYLQPEVTVELYAVGNSNLPHRVTRVHWGANCHHPLQKMRPRNRYRRHHIPNPVTQGELK